MSDPGQIWLLSFKIPLDRIDEDGIGFQGTEAAGLSESEDSLHPAVAFSRAGSLRALSPQDPEADHPFGIVVDWGVPREWDKSRPVTAVARRGMPELRHR